MFFVDGVELVEESPLHFIRDFPELNDLQLRSMGKLSDGEPILRDVIIINWQHKQLFSLKN